MKQSLEYRKVNKYGMEFLEARYKGTPWTGWLFAISKEPKAHWIYVEEYKVWRCNVSAF